MEIKLIRENKDGSADITMELTEEENEILVEYAVINMLKDYIERSKKHE